MSSSLIMSTTTYPEYPPPTHSTSSHPRPSHPAPSILARHSPSFDPDLCVLSQSRAHSSFARVGARVQGRCRVRRALREPRVALLRDRHETVGGLRIDMLNTGRGQRTALATTVLCWSRLWMEIGSAGSRIEARTSRYLYSTVQTGSHKEQLRDVDESNRLVDRSFVNTTKSAHSSDHRIARGAW